jgi:hypothetical protein
LRREASPGGVLLSDQSQGGILRYSHLEAAIAAVPNLDHFLILSPSTDIVVPVGGISVPGPITYL